MRFVKVFGLAALAVMATMAFIGGGSASAQVHGITLCKELITLCPKDKLWPSLTIVKALATNPELHVPALGESIKCKHSEVTAESSQAVGNPYLFKNVKVKFGLELTQDLGTGCTGACVTGGPERIHATLENLRIVLEFKENKHFYYLLGEGLALILNCPFVGTCVYRSAHVKRLIQHHGTHPLHAGNNLPLVKFEETLNRQTTHGGSSFCPATSQWLANYVFTLAEFGPDKGLAWPALDFPLG